MKRLVVILLLVIAFNINGAGHAQTADRPFILPVAGEPGPDSWLFGQPYGNTVGAYNFGSFWYEAGQGLHFGLDFPMPCGTPLVAVADGNVAGVDNLSRGAGPHNLLLEHPQHGVTTLYGHLVEPAPLTPGQQVRQGDIVGYSGDPDSTCDSRPHLHFEVRSLNYFTAYNPVDYIDANWHMLASIGGYSYPLFQGDMNNPRQWMSLEDQPATAFGGRRLNNYGVAWPLPFDLRPPSNPPILRNIEPIPADADWALRRIGFDQCCWQKWWDPLDADRLYAIDGSGGTRGAVIAFSAETGNTIEVVSDAPPAVTSPDGTYAIFNNGNTNLIQHRLSDAQFTVQTGRMTPAISTDNSRLTWTTRSGADVPGQAEVSSTVWVAAIDGSSAAMVRNDRGISASWLDDRRLLLRTPGEGRSVTLAVHDTQTGEAFDLGTFTNMRNLSIAPGGNKIMFYLTWQNDPAVQPGIYVMDTAPGATPQPLPWFGGWRWRDADSVFYLPYQPQSANHSLHLYDLNTGEDRLLAGPATDDYFTVMNGDWQVSADGTRITFQNAVDSNMWLLEMTDDLAATSN